MQRNGPSVGPSVRVRLQDLPADADEELLWELGTQFGIVKRVFIPKDPTTRQPMDHAFVDFGSPEDAAYMVEALNIARIKLYNRPLRVMLHEKGGKRGREDDRLGGAGSSSLIPRTELFEIGAKIIVKGMDRSTTMEEVVRVFGSFSGGVFAVPPRLLKNRDGEFTGAAIISYNSFGHSDAALSMNGNSMKGRTIYVEYAERPDGTKHGSAEERALYASQKTLLEQQVEEEERLKSQRAAEIARGSTMADWSKANPYASV
jgi:RNA recognition motif-containing protein